MHIFVNLILQVQVVGMGRARESECVINPFTPTWRSQRQLSPIHLCRHDVGYVKSGTSSPKSFQRVLGLIRQRRTWQWDSVWVSSRYGSIAPAPAALHTVPTVPKFSALLGGIGVRGFYIIMRAGRERVNLLYEGRLPVNLRKIN